MEKRLVEGIVIELVDRTHAGVLAWAECKTPCLCQGGSFSNQIHVANNKTNAETGTAQALFDGQRMEKWKPSSQINFSTQFGQRHQKHKRVQLKGRELERKGGIVMSYPKTWVWFGPGIDATLLFSSFCMGLSG